MLSRAAALPPEILWPDGKRLSLRAYGILFLLCLAFFIPGFVSLPPTDRDESLFAQASKQMIESDNYFDIRIQDVPRYKKPIGIYWLQTASVRLLNPDHLKEIWAYRVPSLIGDIIAVLMTAALGALLFGPEAGFLAGIMMASCVILNAEARQAKTDSALLATIMIAQYAMARAYFRQAEGLLVPLAFWTAMGTGILIKGPIILLVVLGTLVWIWAAERNLGWLKALKPWAGVPLALLITLPWLIGIGIASHGAFYEQSAGHDMMGKVGKGEFRGMIPPGAHLLAFPAIFFPFSLLGLLAIPDAWKNKNNPAQRFCLGWIIPSWIVFELSLTKLPHYTMPLYPAIAMLAAKSFRDGFPALGENRRWFWLPPVAISVWLMIGTALALAAALGPYLINHAWNAWGIVAAIALLASQGAALFLFFQRKEAGIIVMSVGFLIFTACVFGSILPTLQDVWLSQQVVQAAELTKRCEKLEIISATYNEPSLIFLAGTDIQFNARGDLAAEAMEKDPCLLGLIDQEHEGMFKIAFPKKSYQPIALATIKGFNTARGRPISMTLYALPPPKTKPITKKR